MDDVPACVGVGTQAALNGAPFEPVTRPVSGSRREAGWLVARSARGGVFGSDGLAREASRGRLAALSVIISPRAHDDDVTGSDDKGRPPAHGGFGGQRSVPVGSPLWPAFRGWLY